MLFFSMLHAMTLNFDSELFRLASQSGFTHEDMLALAEIYTVCGASRDCTKEQTDRFVSMNGKTFTDFINFAEVLGTKFIEYKKSAQWLYDASEHTVTVAGLKKLYEESIQCENRPGHILKRDEEEAKGLGADAESGLGADAKKTKPERAEIPIAVVPTVVQRERRPRMPRRPLITAEQVDCCHATTCCSTYWAIVLGGTISAIIFSSKFGHQYNAIQSEYKHKYDQVRANCRYGWTCDKTAFQYFTGEPANEETVKESGTYVPSFLSLHLSTITGQVKGLEGESLEIAEKHCHVDIAFGIYKELPDKRCETELSAVNHIRDGLYGKHGVIPRLAVSAYMSVIGLIVTLISFCVMIFHPN